MIKYDIENDLQKARNESNKFFSKFPYEKMREAVFLKIESDRKSHLSKKRFNFRLTAKFSVLSACCIILLAVVFSFKIGFNFGDNKRLSMGKPVSQQLIKFDNSDLYQWLYFFNINKPDKIDDSLLAVIWNSNTNGNYEMAYSSLLENSNKPCPIAMITFPDGQPSLVIISSQNDDKKYIHYRILGYKENEFMAFIEQNYVTGGKIEVIDGVLKETRLAPNTYIKEGDDMRQLITYYIPYQSNESGDIILPVKNLKINKGEFIAIIGDKNTPVETLNSDLLLYHDTAYKLLNIDESVNLLHAENSGREDLYIRPLNGGTPDKISVEVVDNK
jgi:hypothetical protein